MEMGLSHCPPCVTELFLLMTGYIPISVQSFQSKFIELKLDRDMGESRMSPQIHWV